MSDNRFYLFNNLILDWGEAISRTELSFFLFSAIHNLYFFVVFFSLASDSNQQQEEKQPNEVLPPNQMLKLLQAIEIKKFPLVWKREKSVLLVGCCFFICIFFSQPPETYAHTHWHTHKIPTQYFFLFLWFLFYFYGDIRPRNGRFNPNNFN